MREPGIHISKSSLVELLKKHIKEDPNSFIDDLMREAKSETLLSRSMVATNQKQRKVVNSLLQSDKSDADMVAKIIQVLRIRMGHTGIKKIRENGREWPKIKELTNCCNQFCEDFHLEKREGFIKYLETGLKHIKSYYGYLDKLINMYDSICQEMQAVKELTMGNTEQGLSMHDVYIAMIADRTGIQESYANNATKMACFYRAAKQAAEIGCDNETWMEAQFDALSFCNGIPTPEQLYGDKAKERLTKYLYKHNVQLDSTQVKSVKESDWDSILGV